MSAAWEAGDQGRLEAIVDALVRRHARAVERIASHRWQLTFASDRRDRNVTCTVQEGWILLDEAAVTDTDPLALVAHNRTLPCCLKLAVFTDGSVHIRAELPIIDDDELSVSLTGVLCAFGASHVVAADNAAPDAQVSLGELSTEAGWQYTDRPDGRIAVELEVPGVFQQAIIDRVPDGLTRVGADLGASASIDAPGCRPAVAALLLRVAGAVRMVRVAADCSADGFRPRLEVVLSPPAKAAEVGHALAALSLACQLCAREVEVLRSDETAARAYLETLE